MNSCALLPFYDGYIALKMDSMGYKLLKLFTDGLLVFGKKELCEGRHNAGWTRKNYVKCVSSFEE